MVSSEKFEVNSVQSTKFEIWIYGTNFLFRWLRIAQSWSTKRIG